MDKCREIYLNAKFASNFYQKADTNIFQKTMQLSTRYLPEHIEEKIYNYWLKGGYFYSVPDERTPYTIVIPPPNVTGVLHIGHMLNSTLQDVLARCARMRGYNVCWVPGTDHASIATEAKVVAQLKKEKTAKDQIGREAFINRAWEWTHEHGGIILKQLKKLGCSCDWKRTCFTMDQALSRSVIRCFVDLYRRGWIYRGYQMVHWDPEAKTTVSDEEVRYEERKGALYYIKYSVLASDEYLIVATTRPETLFGDTAIAVHPQDARYTHLIGKEVLVPIVGRRIPVVEDGYVDKEFGSGCLKITPAHDVNDELLAQRHALEFVDVFNEDGTLNQNGLHYQGKDRFEAREEIIRELQEKGILVKTEPLIHKVGLSERTGVVIEPRRSMQWFLKTQFMAQQALEAVKTGGIRFYPKKFENTYYHWMENIRDWNISRQLWWGHRIPVYYINSDPENYVVAQTHEEALLLARQKIASEDLSLDQLKQEEDVLDTWFSSWIWPISVFDGISHPDNSAIKYYYPTKDLVTGPDILFFWVARMIMAGYAFRSKKPFENVYFTGIVRDDQRRKMSKSLGNSPDPVALMDKYGTDGMRVGLLLSTQAGNDLLFNEELCLQGRNFANKIWNAFRLIKSWETAPKVPLSEQMGLVVVWFENQFHRSFAQVEKHFEKYEISQALQLIYKLIWEDFCSWYLEIVKPAPRALGISEFVYSKTLVFFENLLKLLHPYMPFITEEIWQQIQPRSKNQALIVSSWPNQRAFDDEILQEFDHAVALVKELRALKKHYKLSSKTLLSIFTDLKNKGSQFDAVVSKMAHPCELVYTEKKPVVCQFSFLVGTKEYFVCFKGEIDKSEEFSVLQKALKHQEDFLAALCKKLSNEQFVSRAPKEVVALEQKKQADAMIKIKALQERLEKLK